MSRHATLLAAIGLLLVHFLIRSQSITQLEPYVDEGTHMTRAAVVWNFDAHPARFSHGKLLVYFWLGLFDGPPSTNLAAGRLAIALFSTITGAALFLLGRWLWNPYTGLLALGIYALLPYAFFFERMALADPFAAGFAVLVAWRSLAFARHPTLREGFAVGLLLALASMAKLTMALLPLLTVTAVLWVGLQRGDLRRGFLRSLPGLCVAALVVILMWLPILIPAYVSQQTDHPFILVNEFNIQRDDAFAPTGPLDYLVSVLPLIAEFTSPIFLIGAGMALVMNGLRRQSRGLTLFVLVWLLIVALPVILLARVVTARYLMTLAAPLTLALAAGLDQFRRLPIPTSRQMRQAAGIGVVTAWMVTFAVPFAQATPRDLPFSGNNVFDFQSGFLTADDRVREAAQVLSEIQPAGIVYATKEACHMLSFYSDNFTLRCLDDDPVPTFGQTLRHDLASGQAAYLVISWYYGPFHLGIDWLQSEEIPLHTPPRFQGPGYEFRLWRIHMKQI
ncbi:MAG: glycosyltransferase family 39 protein [Anaerolineae bacterium]|nr:glycosyltransferase family 39 protein [Anaerolineae bacterium]